MFFWDKGDKLQPIVDYKQLNSHCVKDIYPLPRIDETISHLKKAKIYSKYDVTWAYKRILSRSYSDVSVKGGKREWVRGWSLVENRR